MTERIAAVLGGGGLGLDAGQIADAIWLAQFLTGESGPEPVARAAPGAQPADAEAVPPVVPPMERAGPADPRQAAAAAAPAPAPPATADVVRAPPAGAAPSGVRFRSPAASALSHQLELARALRPLAWRAERPGAWRLVEDVTADRIARTGLWLPELEPETDPAVDLAIVVDASPRLRVWRRVVRELIAVMRSSGVFRTTAIWQIAGDRPDVALRTAGGAARIGAQAVVDAAQRTAVLVISDFAGPLWSAPAGLACLRLWARHMMVALVALVPQRSWSRSVLGALPATRLSAARRGAPSAALRSDTAVVGDALPVPVVSVDPVSLATWARLCAGHAHARARGVLVLPDVGAEARARYAAAAIGAEAGTSADELLPQLTAALQGAERPDEPRDARDRVERFCRGHRPEVVALAAALISAPLELSVMLVVQRAVAPHTGTLELAEILDSGLLEIEPAVSGDDEVRFRIADDVRDHLGTRASIGEHLRVLEVVGAYLRDHLGASIDFEAMVIDPSQPTGPIAERDRRFARLFVDELRRLGIDTGALELDPALAPPPAPGAAAPPDIAPFSGHWVAVAGTEVDALPVEARLACAALGRELALRGFGLRTREWPGVDDAVATAFARTLAAAGIDPSARMDRVPQRRMTVRDAVGDVVALVVIAGRGATRTVQDTMREAGTPIVPFRGSGGVADEVAARLPLAPRAPITQPAEAADEAGVVVDWLCSVVSDPARGAALVMLRNELAVRQPALARQLRLELDGRVMLPAITDPGARSAAAADVALAARDASTGALALALELLAQLAAWDQVATLAASRRGIHGDAMIAADQASRAIADGGDRFQLWRHVATGTQNVLATLNALEVAATLGDAGTMRGSLDGLEALIAHDYEAMRESLLVIGENDAESDAAIRLLRRLLDVVLWLRDPFQAIRVVRRWIARAPDDAHALELLIALAVRTGADGMRAMLDSVGLVSPTLLESLVRAAADLLDSHREAFSDPERTAFAAQIEALSPAGDPAADAIRRAALAASRVCKIHRALGGEQINSGFLIAADLIVTVWQGPSSDQKDLTSTRIGFGGGTLFATVREIILREDITVDAYTELLVLRIEPALGEQLGWSDLAEPTPVSLGDPVALIGFSEGAAHPVPFMAVISELDEQRVSYDLADRDADTRQTGGGPVIDALGRPIAIHYRRMLESPQRRRGITASWVASRLRLRELPGVAELDVDRLAGLAIQYDQRFEADHSDAGAGKLDALIAVMVEAASGATIELALSFWVRGQLGARAVALAICIANPSIAPIEIIADAVGRQRTLHEQWTALQALRRVIIERHPLDADPAIAQLIARLSRKDGFGEGSAALARRVLRRYLVRCGLPDALVEQRTVVELWLAGGAPLHDEPCIAFVGGAPVVPWEFGDLAEALGYTLTRLGWDVVAAAGREVGTRAIEGAQRAGGSARLAASGGDKLIFSADCVIAMAGAEPTGRECSIALEQGIPLLALAFTGGSALELSTRAYQELVGPDVPDDLLAPLRSPPIGEAARLIARVAGVVLAAQGVRGAYPRNVFSRSSEFPNVDLDEAADDLDVFGSDDDGGDSGDGGDGGETA